ncbi:NUDIX domain-containing protein [Bartonella sp. HY329]|uniref:NUDIX domain-containing protein n=1 Tax=unclassified Bartonella TaxID=2645622 RepID=UPI0021CAAF79|nr:MULTISPECIES: NUDIX domain-containing protein [unclassified Bartonella]UXM96004.1 NUDIX domain-containing protein [Bartonella sp. HY329]UXN10329.1 NUDIX domain-containing protein [Bartonella sp. HY328]
MEFNRIRNIAEKILSAGWTRLSCFDFEFQRRSGEWNAQKREVYCRGPASAIVPYDPIRQTVLLTRQLRLPAFLNGDNPMLLEACAGIIDEGETPEIAIMREGEEELGYRFHQLTRIGRGFSSPGYSSEELYLFIATYDAGDRIGAGGGLYSEGEDIEVVEMALEKALIMVENEEIIDLKTILLLNLCKQKFC